MSNSKDISVMHMAAAVPEPETELNNDKVPDFSEKPAYMLMALLLIVLVGLPYAWRGVGEIQDWLELRSELSEYDSAYEDRLAAREHLAAAGADLAAPGPRAENLDSLAAIKAAIRRENQKTVYFEQQRARKNAQVEKIKLEWAQQQKILNSESSNKFAKDAAKRYMKIYEKQLTEQQIKEARADLKIK